MTLPHHALDLTSHARLIYMHVIRHAFHQLHTNLAKLPYPLHDHEADQLNTIAHDLLAALITPDIEQHLDTTGDWYANFWYGPPHQTHQQPLTEPGHPPHGIG